MRQRYVYQIQRRDQNGRWLAGLRRTEMFVRDPKAIARSLLERWVLDHPGEVTGGARLVVSGSGREPEHLRSAVRVLVYREGEPPYAGPAAGAYLGYEVDDRERLRVARRAPVDPGWLEEPDPGWGHAA